MAKQLNWGYTDTPITGVTALNFPRGLVNFSADFAERSDTDGSLVLANITSPLDRVEQVRYARQEVKNVYQNTSIDPKVQSPNRKGVQLLVEFTDIATVTDTSDPSYRVDLPIKTHVVIRVPNDALVDGAVVQTHLGRVVSGLFDTGSTTTTRIEKLLRGALKPD